MSLFSPPNVLVLHLKRFDAFGLNKVSPAAACLPACDSTALTQLWHRCLSVSVRRVRVLQVRAHVSMPTRDLDLGRFFSAAIDGAASARPAAEGVRSMMFDLHGVVCHKGDSLSQVTGAL